MLKEQGVSDQVLYNRAKVHQIDYVGRAFSVLNGMIRDRVFYSSVPSSSRRSPTSRTRSVESLNGNLLSLSFQASILMQSVQDGCRGGSGEVKTPPAARAGEGRREGAQARLGARAAPRARRRRAREACRRGLGSRRPSRVLDRALDRALDHACDAAWLAANIPCCL